MKKNKNQQTQTKEVKVKGFLRRGVRVNPFRRRQKTALKKDDVENKRSNLVRNTAFSAATVAAIIGVGTVAYKMQVKNYRAGFAKSASMAEDLAKQVQIGKVKTAQETILFGVGGLSKNASQQSGERIIMAARKDFSPTKNGIKSVPIDSTKTNPLTQGVENELLASAEYYKGIMREGRNLTAVDLAAQVIAYGDKFPDRQLAMMGYSSGGFAVHEAQEILRIARPDFEPRLKSVTFGTEYWGATKPFGKSVTIGSRQDPFTRFLPTRDLQRFDDVKSHSFNEYGTNKGVQDFIKGFLKIEKNYNRNLKDIGLLEFVKNSPKKRKRTAAEKAAISQGLREYYATQPKKVETKLDKLDKSSKSILRLSRAGANLMSTAAMGLSLAGQLKAMTYKPSRGERVFQNVSAGAGLLSSLSGSYRGFGTGTRSLAGSANIYDDLRLGVKGKKRQYQNDVLDLKRAANKTSRQAQAGKIRNERERNRLKREELRIKSSTAGSYGLIASTSARSNSPGGTKLEDARTRRARLTVEQLENLPNW